MVDGSEEEEVEVLILCTILIAAACSSCFIELRLFPLIGSFVCDIDAVELELVMVRVRKVLTEPVFDISGCLPLLESSN